MATDPPTPPLDLDQRHRIFAAVVEAQDGGTPLKQVRVLVAQRFGVTEAQVTAIEQEGVDNDWPPL